MIKINITAQSTEETVKQIQEVIGGKISERWGEYVLTINNKNAYGTITFITFEWGGSLLEYNITFLDDITLIMDTSEYNPIHFTYTLEGYSHHRFELEDKKRKLEQFQIIIIWGIVLFSSSALILFYQLYFKNIGFSKAVHKQAF